MKAGPATDTAAELRLMLSFFRSTLHAAGSALLVPEGHTLRIRCREPGEAISDAAPLFPAACVLVPVQLRNRPIQSARGCRNYQPACGNHCELLGGRLVYAVSVSLERGERGILAAFGHGNDLPRPDYPRALLAAQLISSVLSQHQAARDAERRASLAESAMRAMVKTIHSLDPDRLIPEIVDGFRRIAPCCFAALWLIDPEEGRLRLAAGHGLSPERLTELEQHGLQQDLLVALYSRRARSVSMGPLGAGGEEPSSTTPPAGAGPTHRPSTQHPALSTRDTFSVEGEGQAYILPIYLPEEPLGVAVLGGVRQGDLPREELDILEQFTEGAAVALSNARLHQQVNSRLQAKLRDVANLTRISEGIGASLQPAAVLQNIAHGTAEAFESAGSAILLVDDEGKEMTVVADAGMGLAHVGRRLPVDDSASGWVVRHKQPLFLPSVPGTPFGLSSWFGQQGIKSFIAVPLVTQGAAIGSLNVYSRSGQRFDVNDVELLQGLAAQAAIAITHARLYESLGREKANLESIVESLHEGLLLVDPAGNVAFANKRFYDLLGLDSKTLESQSRAAAGPFTPAGPAIRFAGSGCSGSPTSASGFPPHGSAIQIWKEVAARCAAPEEAFKKLKSLEDAPPRSIELTIVSPSERHLEVHGFQVLTAKEELLGRGYLFEDVTERAEIERLKASVLSIVSHELRSPLAAIKGFATSLLRDDVRWDEASQRDFIEQIDHEADRLSGLVRNLLDMSRLDAGMLRLDRKWCNIPEMVAGTLRRMAPLLDGHRVELAQESPRIVARVDKKYLERVVWNLVENAVKYSPRESAVTVSIARDADHFVLKVGDSGAGIRPEERERIFERFYRGKEARVSGIGLGLPICRGIVEAHGGSIWVDSEPGRGSVFSVHIPCRPE